MGCGIEPRKDIAGPRLSFARRHMCGTAMRGADALRDERPHHVQRDRTGTVHSRRSSSRLIAPSPRGFLRVGHARGSAVPRKASSEAGRRKALHFGQGCEPGHLRHAPAKTHRRFIAGFTRYLSTYAQSACVMSGRPHGRVIVVVLKGADQSTWNSRHPGICSSRERAVYSLIADGSLVHLLNLDHTDWAVNPAVHFLWLRWFNIRARSLPLPGQGREIAHHEPGRGALSWRPADFLRRCVSWAHSMFV